jgi:hypothetical protein
VIPGDKREGFDAEKVKETEWDDDLKKVVALWTGWKSSA